MNSTSICQEITIDRRKGRSVCGCSDKKGMYQVCRGDRRYEPSSVSLVCHRASDKGAEANAPRKCRWPKGQAPRVGGGEVRIWERLGKRSCRVLTFCFMYEIVFMRSCLSIRHLKWTYTFQRIKDISVWGFSYYNAFVKRRHPFLENPFSLHCFFLINPNLQICCLLKTRYWWTTEIRNMMTAIKHLLFTICHSLYKTLLLTIALWYIYHRHYFIHRKPFKWGSDHGYYSYTYILT